MSVFFTLCVLCLVIVTQNILQHHDIYMIFPDGPIIARF